ncbi:MAG: DUF927 domain-containing protein [Rhodocyclales bacterium]|nr:DUF927 domain-containing protein [Rhodocyclales bacterium]
MKRSDRNPAANDSPQSKSNNSGKKSLRTITVAGHRYCFDRDGYHRLHLGEKLERICGFIKFVAHRADLGSDQIQVAVKIRDFHHTIKIIVVNRSDVLSGFALIDRLTNCGFEVSDKTIAAKIIRQAYLAHPPKETVLIANYPGWHSAQPDGVEVYVTNMGTIKPSYCKANIALADGISAGFATAGTLEEWNCNIGDECVGNSRLQFGVCISLASSLVHFSGLPNFGSLIEGPSKSGKTITLRVAGSVMGSDDYMYSWNSTPNALERIAVNRNDGLLPLDEIGQGEPRAVAEAVYDLTNGRTKSRLGADTKLESGTRFRGLVLASGELDLRTFLGNAGIKAKAGQLVRLFSIPVPRGGVFSKKHGHKNKASFAAELVENMAEYYGTLGPAFIAYIAENQIQLKAELPDMVRDIADELLSRLPVIPDPGTYGHVAKCFALVAIAGELAVSNKLLTWEQRSARAAVERCFLAWAKREKVIFSTSDHQVFRQLQRFFQSEKAGKFVPMREFECSNKATLAGYLHKVDGASVYLVYPAFFETKLCSRFGKSIGIRLLKERNLLVLGSRGTPTRQVNIPKSLQSDDQTKVSFYVIREEILRI